MIKARFPVMQQLLVGACVVGSLLLGAPGVAYASDPGLAAQLYKEAKVLYEAGQIRESLGKLKAAYEAYANDKLLLSIANRHLDLGEPEEAQETLSRIVPETSEMKTQVERLRKQITRELQQPVAVRLVTDVEGATVSVDGGPATPLPLRVKLPRGKHRFLFASSDGTSREVEESLRGSMEQLVEVSLTKPVARWRLGLEPVASLQDVRLSIDGEEVVLDDEERTKPVTQPREVEPGPHTVICLRGIDERTQAEFVAVAGEVGVVTCAFGGGGGVGKDRSTFAWISGTGALAAITGSIALHLSYKADEKKYANDRYKIRSSKPEFSIVLGVTGAALGGLSAYLFLSE